MMKKITFILLCMVFAVCSFGQASSISLESEIIDVGKLNELGGIVRLRVPVVNNGSSPVLIEYVKSSCACICTNWPKEPVNPNEHVMIIMTFDPLNRSGLFQKTVVIHTSENIDLKVYVRGEIIPAQTEPNSL